MAAREGLGAVIPVTPAPEPTPPDFDFRREVYERGEDTIRQIAGLAPLRVWPGKKPAQRVSRVDDVTHSMLREFPHWTRASDALHRAYKGMCAYTARYIEPVEQPTTDHFVALKNTADVMLAYTWSNYRLSHALPNGNKQSDAGVLDPFLIGEGWFALDLGSFKTIIGPDAPPQHHAAIQHTITTLGLDSAALAETRRRAANKYWSPPSGKPPLPLYLLEDDEPFLAAELRRQGRLNPGDA